MEYESYVWRGLLQRFRGRASFFSLVASLEVHMGLWAKENSCDYGVIEAATR